MTNIMLLTCVKMGFTCLSDSFSDCRGKVSFGKEAIPSGQEVNDGVRCRYYHK